MKQLQHIILVILLMSIAFADNQPMRAVTTDGNDIDTTADTLSAKMDSAINLFVNSKAMTGATVGICVMDIQSGRTVASIILNDNSFLPP